MLQRCFEALRPARPMVHCITNSVTINDCANVLLAAGARPIMADDPEESAEITAACRALVLNLGMLSPRKLEAMVKSGHQANRMGIPVVLDPVGAGASTLRTRAAYTLLEEVRFAAVRGNGSEIRVLAAVKTTAAWTRPRENAPPSRSGPWPRRWPGAFMQWWP